MKSKKCSLFETEVERTEKKTVLQQIVEERSWEARIKLARVCKVMMTQNVDTLQIKGSQTLLRPYSPFSYRVAGRKRYK